MGFQRLVEGGGGVCAQAQAMSCHSSDSEEQQPLLWARAKPLRCPGL